MQSRTIGSGIFNIKALRTIYVVLLSAQLPLLAASLPLTLHAPAAIAETQKEEDVARVAQAITVRIEGATQGSGVLVKRDDNTYTVLTAWHVVREHNPREELDIYTPDGQRHLFEPGSIRQVGGVDMAVLTFTSSRKYKVATSTNSKILKRQDEVLVSGFPIKDREKIAFSRATIAANATAGIDMGYQLMYVSNRYPGTFPGMSGGPIINTGGQLVGIHGRGEIYQAGYESRGIVEKTRRNMGIPINYYLYFTGRLNQAAIDNSPKTYDDYLSLLGSIFDFRGVEFSTKDQLINAYKFIGGVKSEYIRDDIAAIKRQVLWALGMNSEAIDFIDNSSNTFGSLHDKALALADMGKTRDACMALKNAAKLFPENGTNSFPRLSHYFLFLINRPQFSKCFTVQGDGGFQLDRSLPIFYKPF